MSNNLTPFQKAIELIEEFKKVPAHEPFFIMSLSQCKQCAVISVNEILNAINWMEHCNGVEKSHWDYWKEVKKEIEKL